MEKKLKEVLETLCEEARELYLPSEIPILEEPPSPLRFLRDYVSPNRPVIIKNALKKWTAQTKWTNGYLRDVLGSTPVSVTVTPNGYADAPLGDRFVLPEERLMLFKDFLDIWARKVKANGVFYIQKQNSNFTDEFNQLVKDADDHIGWATEALGSKPDAVNFWMGNSDAVTSMHKDHYENLYAVVQGEKTFILHPPTDLPNIPYCQYTVARYHEKEDGNFDVVDEQKEILSEDDENATERTSNEADREDYETAVGSEKCKVKSQNEKVSWIAIDPLNPNFDTYPRYAKCHRYIAKVSAGDLLYLPSLWFHHVTQTDQTIAVNFWYDMEFDIKYNYFKFMEEVSNII